MNKIDVQVTFPSGADRSDSITVTVECDFYAFPPLISTIWEQGGIRE